MRPSSARAASDVTGYLERNLRSSVGCELDRIVFARARAFALTSDKFVNANMKNTQLNELETLR